MSPKPNFYASQNIRDAILNFMDDKKSFDKLEQEIEIYREIIRIKIAKEYVPWFCNSLWRDRPDLKSTKIRIIAISRLPHMRRGEILREVIGRKR